MPMTLFAFDGASHDEWEVVNDGVMGGRSQGFVTVENGVLQFTGTIVTDGGGFTSVRGHGAFDLTDRVGFELRVRGCGRQFEVALDDALRIDGRRVSRRAPFLPTADWTRIRVPFDALRSTIHGRSVNAPPMDLKHIRGVGLFIADGQDGPFRLEVDQIAAYGADEG